MLGNYVTTKNHAVNAEQYDVTAQGMVTGTIFVKHFNFYFKILKQVVLPVHEKSFFLHCTPTYCKKEMLCALTYSSFKFDILQ